MPRHEVVQQKPSDIEECYFPRNICGTPICLFLGLQNEELEHFLIWEKKKV